MTLYKRILVCLFVSLMWGCSRESYVPLTPEGAPGATIPIGTPVTGIQATEPMLEEQPAPTSGFDEWQKTLTTENPTRDAEVIKSILLTLLDRFSAQFDKVGWYKFDESIGLMESHLHKVTWVHIDDPEQLNFDQYFAYYDVPGVYAPGTVAILGILTRDGKQGSGGINESLDDYRFKQPEYTFREPPVTNLINPDLILDEGIDELHFGDDVLSRLVFLQDHPLETEPDGNTRDYAYAAWFEKLEGQTAFVLKENLKYGGTLPRTASGERVKEEETLLYFNLENGGQIMHTGTWYFLSGNSDSSSEPHGFDNIEWYAELPAGEQARYDEACKRLDEFLSPP